MPGDCHYLEGNTNARRRVNHLQDLLEKIGLEKERVRMFNLSAAMAGQFVEMANEMTEQIKVLGPNPLRNSQKESEE
ncbi:MAG: hydrogenase iron-sulfur subunit [Anaerolineales bacterium]|nr:hydrogenase iron-sulfur subunit [Anaerolineales bacterium]